MSSNEIKIIKSPTVLPQGEREDYLEYTYQSKIIYYVHLSNGLIATKPDDFPDKVEEKEKLS